jgi:hypothetical protein
MTEQVIAVVGIIGMKVYYKVRRPLRPLRRRPRVLTEIYLCNVRFCPEMMRRGLVRCER